MALTCSPAGAWYGSSGPAVELGCTKVTGHCPDITVLKGWVAFDGLRVLDSTATLSCQTGFRLGKQTDVLQHSVLR